MSLTTAGLALTLVGWAAIVAALRRRTGREDTLRGALVESMVVALSVSVIALLGAQSYLNPDHPFLASDFDQYCSAVAGVRSGDHTVIPPQRGLPGALIPGLLASSLGVIDALFLTASVSLGIGVLGLAGWARAAFGTGAGALAAVMILGFTPFAVVGRLLTFLPATLALSWLAMGAAALAFRFRSVVAAVCTLTLSSALMWLDIRGVVWATLPALVALATFHRLSGEPRRWAIPVAAVLSLSVSWWMASITIPPGTPGFETQSLRMLEEQARLVGAVGHDWPGLMARAASDEFLWGHRGGWHLFSTLWRVGSARMEIPGHVDHRFSLYVGPWAPVAVTAYVAAVATAVFRRCPRSLAGLLLAFPAVLTLHSSQDGIAHPRYLAMAAPAVVAGLAALAGLTGDWLAHRDPSRARRRGAVRRQVPLTVVPMVTGFLGIGLIFGGVPTPLGLQAAWRGHVMPDTEPDHTVQVAAGARVPSEVREAACIDALREDHARGLPFGSRLMDWGVPPSP